MPTRHPGDFLDDLFLGCAFAAYLDQAAEEGGPPDCEATRRRAYAYFERELAAKNGRAEATNASQVGAHVSPRAPGQEARKNMTAVPPRMAADDQPIVIST